MANSINRDFIRSQQIGNRAGLQLSAYDTTGATVGTLYQSNDKLSCFLGDQLNRNPAKIGALMVSVGLGVERNHPGRRGWLRSARELRERGSRYLP